MPSYEKPPSTAATVYSNIRKTSSCILFVSRNERARGRGTIFGHGDYWSRVFIGYTGLGGYNEWTHARRAGCLFSVSSWSRVAQFYWEDGPRGLGTELHRRIYHTTRAAPTVLCSRRSRLRCCYSSGAQLAGRVNKNLDHCSTLPRNGSARYLHLLSVSFKGVKCTCYTGTKLTWIVHSTMETGARELRGSIS